MAWTGNSFQVNGLDLFEFSWIQRKRRKIKGHTEDTESS